MNFKDKLKQLFKLQLSVNALTEEVFKKQLVTFTESQVPQKKNTKHLEPPTKISELSKIIQSLRQQNNELASSIRKNLSQINSQLEPLTEKTLNLLVIAQQHIPTNLNPEFLSDKCAIEEGFRNISNYIFQFFDLFQEFKGTESDFDRFSTISDSNFSTHQIETEDIELTRAIKVQESNLTDDSLQTEQFLRILESEIECDKNSLNTLSGIMKKVEYEKDSLMRNKGFDRISLVGRIIEEFLGVLRTCLTEKKSRMADLRSVKTNINKSVQVRSRRNNSFENMYKKQQLSNTLTQNHVITSMSNSVKSDFKHLDIFKPFEFDVDHLNITSSESSKSSISKPPIKQSPIKKDLQAPNNQIKDLQVLIENLKSNELKNDQEIQKLQNLNNSLKKHIKSSNLAVFEALAQVKLEIKSVKEFCFSELERAFNEIGEKSELVSKKTGKWVLLSKQKYSQEIENLNDSNEGFQAQIEALKEVFQGEVRKMNNETTEVKKMNKELKDSIMKINTVYERQSRCLFELGRMVNVVTGEHFDGLEKVIGEYCRFVDELIKEFGEKDLSKLLLKVKSGIV